MNRDGTFCHALQHHVHHNLGHSIPFLLRSESHYGLKVLVPFMFKLRSNEKVRMGYEGLSVAKQSSWPVMWGLWDRTKCSSQGQG